ncbi:MAG: hypothetical protein Q4G46_03340, partial [Propionibacteriaceae bacterium]|nr:hypothetical protein [Propionibacteriaceae bacterium]
IYAFIVLGAAVVALTLFGGPERRARAVTVSDEEIRIERFHRITTVVRRADLASVNAESRQDRGGRTRAELVLTPRDPIAFFSRHRELRIVRDHDAARIPVGTGARTVADLNEALSRRAA